MLLNTAHFFLSNIVHVQVLCQNRVQLSVGAGLPTLLISHEAVSDLVSLSHLKTNKATIWVWWDWLNIWMILNSILLTLCSSWILRHPPSPCSKCSASCDVRAVGRLGALDKERPTSYQCHSVFQIHSIFALPAVLTSKAELEKKKCKRTFGE